MSIANEFQNELAGQATSVATSGLEKSVQKACKTIERLGAECDLYRNALKRISEAGVFNSELLRAFARSALERGEKLTGAS